MIECAVSIIGGGPAGSISAAKLAQEGYDVVVVDRSDFPRFVIGESLLPRCNELLEKANMLDAVEKAGFQFKGGACFEGEKDSENLEIYDFSKNRGEKWGSSFQVRREEFDKILLDEAMAKGAKVYIGQEVIGYDEASNIITVKDRENKEISYHAKKVLDASGYGRVLPKLLNLDTEPELPTRRATFCRMRDDIRPDDFTEGYIYIFVHGDNEGWIWNIPFSDGVTSVGIVCKEEYYQSFAMSEADFFDHIITTNKLTKERYKHASKVNEVGTLYGYSAAVKTMVGKNFLLTGNASEFLDPVFSSGVTLALESGSKAAELVSRELKGEKIDYKVAYEEYMMLGINVFREFVDAWYDGRLQEIFFYEKENPQIKRAIVSILSGYVWDNTNIFVKNPKQAINSTLQIIHSDKWC